jgi:hypothetical protein
MTRVLEPELLDELPATDARAIHSRRDLRRLNTIMGHARYMERFIKQFLPGRTRLRVAEIGAGDGNMSVRLTRILPISELTLVDRNPTDPGPQNGLVVRVTQSDVFDWLKDAPRVDVIVANLFLHHFRDDALCTLLTLCETRCDCFVSGEPRRNPFARWLAKRVGWIGCNGVTRHDAVISVNAGFNDNELTSLWPRDAGHWTVTEFTIGHISHFFAAARRA